MKMKKIESDMKLPDIRIAFLDVGQGDIIVVSCPATQEAIVIDCVDAKSVVNYLKTENIIHLRGIIITHLHADHYVGVATLLDNYHSVPGISDCEVLVFNEIFNQKNLQILSQDDDGHSSSYEKNFGETNRPRITALTNLLKWREQNKTKYATLQVQRDSLPFEGTLTKSFHLLHPYAADYRYLETKGLNNTSVVLRIDGPGSSALLMSDLEPNGWKQLQTNHPDLHCDVFKFPHHGAWKDADADKLLDSITPSIVVMSVGTEGYEKYNHPNPHVFNALASRPSIRLLCTQATDQCKASVQSMRSSVINSYKTQAINNNQQLIFSKRGCPCAGTIVVELGGTAHVIQPDPQFHQEKIIKTHFNNHKCKYQTVQRTANLKAMT